MTRLAESHGRAMAASFFARNKVVARYEAHLPLTEFTLRLRVACRVFRNIVEAAAGHKMQLYKKLAR